MEKCKKIELIPPDGGYGYIILIAVVINLSIYGIYLNCYGLIYKEYFLELNMDSRDITFLGGFSAMFSSLAGFLTAPLLKLLTKRKTAIIASVFYNCGIFYTVFAKSKIIFFIFQGIVQNIGIGLISNTIINEYFVKKRLFAISLAQTAVAFVGFIAPQILQWTSEIYGYRGALIMVCAISVHTFVAGALMQPISWHMKKAASGENEIKLLIKANNETATTETDQNINQVKSNLTLHTDLKSVKKHGISCRMKNLLDVELMKSFTLSMECLGPSLSVIMDLTYLYMLPQALQSYGWSEASVAWAFSLLALGDLLMRIFIILLNKWFNKLGSSKFYVAGIVMTFIARLGVSISNNVPVTLAFLTIMGASRCIIFIVLALVISEAVGPEKYSDAIGIFMLTGGIENLTLAPIIGAVRDYTQNYTIALNLINAVFGTIGAAWIVKLSFFKNDINRNNASSNKNEM